VEGDAEHDPLLVIECIGRNGFVTGSARASTSRVRVGVRVVGERYMAYSHEYLDVRVSVREYQPSAVRVMGGRDAAAGRGVGDAVADGDGVGVARQRELDVLAGRVELDGAAAEASAARV